MNMQKKKKIPRVLNIVPGTIMGDAQALSGVGEELEESRYHVGPHEKQS